MPRHKVVLLSGKVCESETRTDVLYFMYGEFKAGRLVSPSPIYIQVFHEGKKGHVDIRKIDPEATFVPAVAETIAA